MGKFVSSAFARALSVVLSFTLATGSVGGVAPAFAAEPAAVSAESTSAAEVPRVVEEIVALREEDESVYRLSDGTTRTVVWAGPVRYEDEAGTWRALDPKVVTDGTDLRGTGVPYEVTFPATPSSRLMRMSDDGWSVTVSLLGGAQSGAIALGDTVVLPAVAKDTDLVYQLGESSVKETAVLASSDAPDEFTFRLDTKGLEIVSDSRGVQLLDTATKQVALTLGTLEVFDNAGVACEQASTQTRVQDDAVFVTYRIPRAWLEAEDRAWPVRVDPTLSAVCDTYVSSNSSTPQGNASTLKAGRLGSGVESKALFRFDLTSIPATASVLSAAFTTDAQPVGEAASRLAVARVVSGWSNNTVWANQPTAVYTERYTSQVTGTSEPMRALVAGWLSGSYANNGVELYYYPSTGANSEVAISSSESNAAVKPALAVDWSNAIPAPGPTKARYTADGADTVTATFSVDAAATEAHVSVVGSSTPGVREGFRLAWFSSLPSASSWDASAATGGGFFAVPKNSAYPASFRPELSRATVGGTRRELVISYRLRPTFGDVQRNRTDSAVRIGTGTTVWTSGTATFDVLPAAVSSATAAARGLSWGRALDSDFDGMPDPPADGTKARKSAVALSWNNIGSPAANPTALGTRVYLQDGRDWKLVASVPNTATTGGWDTEGQGIFPSAAQLARQGASGRRLLGVAQSPCTATVEASAVISTVVTSTGAVATDGTYLYVRPRNAGSSFRFRRIGTGSGGTAAGADYGAWGPTVDWSDNAWVADGYLCGVRPTNGEAVLTCTQRISLDAPELGARDWFGPTGLCFASAITGHGPYVYGVSKDINTGQFSISSRDTRAYNTSLTAGSGVPSTTRSLPNGFDVAFAIADGSSLLVVEHVNTGSIARVARIDTTTWTETARWTIDNRGDTLSAGCYDEAADLVWFGRSASGGFDHGLTAAGTDLADDPRHLYRVTNPSQMASCTVYNFKVVPYNSAGSADLSSVPTLTVTPPNRTLGVADDVRHTAHALDRIAAADAELVLDRSALVLSDTDISVPFDGPELAVRRTYHSDLTTQTHGAAGWRFNFGARVDADSSGATYTDSEGETHRFTKAADNTYHSPTGMFAWLTRSGTTGPFTLVTKDRSTLSFDASGRIASVADSNGRTVTYVWNDAQGRLSITAGSALPTIRVTFASGRISRAEEGRRCAHYASGATTYTVTTHSAANTQVSDSHTPAESSYCETLTREFSYVASRVAQARIKDYPAAGADALWGLSYDMSGKVTRIDMPGSADDPYARTDVAYGTREATITAYGMREGDPHTPIRTAYAWNPNGTTCRETASRYDDEPVASTTFEYGPTNAVCATNRADGSRETRQVDGSGNVVASTDASGAVTTMQYDDFDRLHILRTPGGGERRYYHDSRGNVTREERLLDASGALAVTERTFNTEGRQTRVRELSDEASDTWTGTYMTYDSAGRLINEATPVSLNTTGIASTFEIITTYDTRGNVTARSEGGWLSMTEATYTGAGRMLQSRSCTNGAYTYMEYDALGNEVHTRSWSATQGTGEATQTTGHYDKTYDALGRVLCEKSLLGTDTVASRVTHVYDLAGREVAAIDSVAGTTTTEFDGQGRPIAEWGPGTDTTDPLASTRTRYDQGGNEWVVTEPGADASCATTTTYDACGRELSSRAPDGSVTQTTYDAAGNAVETTSSGVHSHTAYDLAGRAVQSATSGETTTTHTFDALGREVATHSENTTPTVRVFNERGWLLSETDPQGVVTKHGYKLDGRPRYRCTFYPRWVTTFIEVDDGNPSRIPTVTSVPGTVSVDASYEYNDSARMRREVTLDGDVIDYYYDAFDRLILVRAEPEIGEPTTETIDYDELSRQIASLQDGEGSEDDVEWDFDYGDEADPVTVQTKMVGDKSNPSLVESTTISPTGETLETSRTSNVAASQQAASQNTSGSGSSSSSSLPAHVHIRTIGTRDAAGRAREISVSTYSDALAWSRTFDGAGHMTGKDGTGFTDPLTLSYHADTGKLTSRTWRLAGDSAQSSANFTYTGSGRLDEVTRDGDTTSHTFDAAGGITALGSRTFSYADGGNLATSSVASATTTYAFDGAGRRTAQASPERAAAFAYDNTGHLTLAQIDAASDGTTDTTVELVYDAQGALSSRSVVSSGTTTTTTYAYAGLSPVRVSESSDTVRISYDEEGAAWLMSFEAQGATESIDAFPITNERGDILALADEDGQVFARYRYTEWGGVESLTSSATSLVDTDTATRFANLQPLRYAGYVYEEATGLYLTGARAYDPESAQFMSKDPARADGEASAYQYCTGDPVGSVDPTGENAVALGSAVVVSWGILEGAAYVGLAVYGVYVLYHKFKGSEPRYRIDYHHPFHTRKGYKMMVENWHKMKGSLKKKILWYIPHGRRPHFHIHDTKTHARWTI